MPTSTQPDLVQAVEDFLRAPRGIGQLGTIVEEIVGESVAAGSVAATAVEGEAAAPLIAGIADGLIDLGGWLIVIVICALIIVLKVLEQILIRSFGIIPFGWGKGPIGIVKVIFAPIDNLELWVGGRIADLATNLIISFISMVRSAIQLSFPGTSHGALQVQPANITHLQSEINTVQGRLASDELAIHNLQAHVYGTQPVTTGITTLEARVARLEQNQAVIAHDLNVLHSDVISISHELSRIQQELSGLSQNLHAVRAVQFGLQDWMMATSGVLTELQRNVGELAPLVDADTRQVLLLKPLEALLTRGASGIRNLQKLEDNPCQCRGFGGLSLKLPDMLSVIEFIENG